MPILYFQLQFLLAFPAFFPGVLELVLMPAILCKMHIQAHKKYAGKPKVTEIANDEEK